ncbi:MAG: hypothetical protein DHS20C18_51360 [Saprospiraceae bacterium]|nr:MAG: hypothetical protein DHS20C18_51360 [Saprospiraceae bacterium]
MEAQSDQYLHFDLQGNDDYVRLDNGVQYINNRDAFSMAGWFYTDELVYGQGMLGFRGANHGFYFIQLSDGIIECRLITTDGFHEHVAPAFSVVPQVWQHFAWVYDGSTVKMYINGVLNGSTPATGQITETGIPFTIGRSILGSLNFYFGGRADEVSVWTKALTPEEITDMMENELTGDEQSLQLYYKFNQGVPGEDNTSITKLVSETGSGERDADLLGFAMTGETSNFGGMLDVGFQAITFPQVPNKLTTDDPFTLSANASSGLPVSFEIVSGPATINGGEVTLTGVAGEVVVKASQAGDGTYNPAEDLVNSFQVLDPNTFVPVIDARSPLAADVFVPELTAIQLAAIANIDYPELFEVQSVRFEINGETINAKDWQNGHYTGWWTPDAYESYTLDIIATNNYGAEATESINFNIVSTASDTEVMAIDGVLLNTSISSEVVDAELPSFLGAFDQITATLETRCPPGGCGEWDRVASLDAKGHDGQWVEIIRYITPYGTPCSHTIDLTDYMSILQGKIAFRVNCGTFDNGYLYDLTINYRQGTPEHKYSNVSVLWQETYDFGNPANLQPVVPVNFQYPANAVESTLKLVSSGHGWGDNNTGNAAEFHQDTHHLWVNGEQTFEQNNWAVCNPNPDGCQPQNGTWFHNRAGWCPGAIAPWFDYDMTPYVAGSNVELGYIFDEGYVDLCHVNNPNCVSGVTCPDCTDGFNPHLVVACNLIVFSDGPVEGVTIVGLDETDQKTVNFEVFPNPTKGELTLSLPGDIQEFDLRILNSVGQVLQTIREKSNFGPNYTVQLGDFPKGIYFIEIQTNEGTGIQRVVLD